MGVKPIGTEYWGERIRDNTSTLGGETRILWKVVDIVKVREHGLWGKFIDAEKIEGIKTEWREVNYFK